MPSRTSSRARSCPGGSGARTRRERGLEAEGAAAVRIERRREDPLGVEARQAEEVDRTVEPDERGSALVADHAVVGDRREAVDSRGRGHLRRDYPPSCCAKPPERRFVRSRTDGVIGRIQGGNRTSWQTTVPLLKSSSSPDPDRASAAQSRGASPARARRSAWSAATRTRSRPPRPRSRRPAARRCAAHRRRRRRSGRRCRGRGREGLRADRHLGEQLDDHGLLLVRRDRARGVQAGERRHLPRHRLGHEGRLQADAAARPRHDRAGRLGNGLPRHSAAVAVLRRQARDQGLRRVAAHGDPREGLEGPRIDGPAARRQHAAVRPLPLEDAAAPDAGAADLRARGRRRRRPLGRPPPPPRGLGRDPDRLHDHRQPARPLARRVLPGEDRRQGPADRRATDAEELRRQPLLPARRRPRRPRPLQRRRALALADVVGLAPPAGAGHRRSPQRRRASPAQRSPPAAAERAERPPSVAMGRVAGRSPGRGRPGDGGRPAPASGCEL